MSSLTTDPGLWGVVVRSIAFCVITAVVTLVVGILIALLMNAIGKVSRLVLQIAARLTLQVSLLLAWAMPVVAAMTVWIWLFDRRRGVVNYLLDGLPGVEMNRFNWLESPTTFFIAPAISPTVA